MSASILDGKRVAEGLKASLQSELRERNHRGLPTPGLAVILVGKDPASQVYVTNKRKACAEVGIQSFAHDLAEDTTEAALLQLIDELNADPRVHGILVQLPLPDSIRTAAVIERIHPAKDVDGFHPNNIGHLAQGNPRLRPCTPYGIIQLLAHYDLSLRGKHVVIVGASNIVGRPMALECLLAKATVTVCHRQTKDLEKHIRMADVVVAATGVENAVLAEWLHSEQIIIDVGIHRGEDGTLCGDIDFTRAKNRVAWITPVPGGVGPMTIYTLLRNTVTAANQLVN